MSYENSFHLSALKASKCLFALDINLGQAVKFKTELLFWVLAETDQTTSLTYPSKACQDRITLEDAPNSSLGNGVAKAPATTQVSIQTPQ